ncbi:MAG: aminotransferase class V-fold PLP-dependent enzyme [Bacteroidetes bacterium]|nr:aminotransferase class V-fold PLP-dependent enzyme [Bacteroidota bacterium]
MNRRNFMQSSSLAAFGIFCHPLSPEILEFEVSKGIRDGLKELQSQAYFSDDLRDPSNEAAWRKIQDLFPRVTSFTQLENGYFSHASYPVMKFYQERENYIQNRSSWFMRKEQEESIEKSRNALGEFFGWSGENLAFTRNTTESLNILIQGFPWKKGDEVVIGDQDYGSMNEAFEQAAQRYGIKLIIADVPVHPKKEDEVVEAYVKHITSNTRMLHLTHLINLTGQVIPLDKICKAARASNKDLCIAVDAAHSVAHIDENWKQLDADVVAGSLHKWMCNPLGLGFLYMNSKWIPQVWPLMGDRNRPQTNIRRFEHQGTRPVQTIEALVPAIGLNKEIGLKNKEARLRYLQKNWTDTFQNYPKIELFVPEYEQGSGAIASLSVKGMSPNELAEKLWMDHHIFTVAINHPKIQAVRVTPHLSNSLDDIQKFKSALHHLVD